MTIEQSFSKIYQALSANTIEAKCALTNELWEMKKELNFDSDSIKSIESDLQKEREILPLPKPTFSYFCEIVPPFKVPHSRELKSDLDFAQTLHALAHIEFCAIDLALDCAYRFCGQKREFYLDWLEVAAQEVAHFRALENALKAVGSYYGAFSVHSTLNDSLQKCQILLHRIALVPRGMEAVGLDANPHLAAKVAKSSHKIAPQMLNALEIILHEEISHVSKGSKWFFAICEAQKVPQNSRAALYFDILRKYNFSFPKANKQLNLNARKLAGFSEQELEILQNGSAQKRDYLGEFASKNPK